MVLTVNAGDATEATASPATLTFTPTNFNIPQTVTVTGVDDLDADGSQFSDVTISVDPANSADEYDLVNDAVIQALTMDNEFTPLAFDFGTQTSPVEAGFTQVTNTDNYSPAIGFGWTGSIENALDRGATVSDLERDFVFTRTTASFLADVPNGNYQVTVRLGDRNAARFDMLVSLEGVQVEEAGLGGLLVLQIEETDIGALGGQHPDDLAADAATSAGNDGRLPFDSRIFEDHLRHPATE